ncbi:MAG: glycoside hydrolase family 13 protein [Lachnospiraceae bacterium]|jgi:alpha-glucosidase|nr:glycoside hydrolase family 13 protein [Lachnospiraceae bacterium]
MNKEALFSDGSSYYLIPSEPVAGEDVKFRFRTLKDDDVSVYLLTDYKKIEMLKTYTEGKFDYYEVIMTMPSVAMYYEFEIRDASEMVYYNRFEVSDKRELESAFRLAPGFKTPSWSKGAVMYQIFIDRFNNGDKNNDVYTGEYLYIDSKVIGVEDWNAPIENMDVRRFYGGDLQGVLDKLDYLEDLGVEVIYFNPLFVSPSNHKYDSQDYDNIDPHLGVIKEEYKNGTYSERTTSYDNLNASNELFIKLVEEMHKRGMKVIIDGVFNHCGSYNKWLDRYKIYENKEGFEKGAYISKDSPYNSYFHFNDNSDKAWPYNNTYVGWWGQDTLPKLQYETSEELFSHVLTVARKWVSPPYNCDGWRLDVAADLGNSKDFNHFFWERFRMAVKNANPEAVIIAEHYGDPSEWLEGDEWDSVMNYDAFMEPVTWFLTGMEKHSDEYRSDLDGNGDYFKKTMIYHMSRMMNSSLLTAMNQLSNHDHSRFLTRTNKKVGRLDKLGAEAAGEGIDYSVMRLAILIQMTWIGSPTLYYGDEVGVVGFTDPDSRRTFPWGNENTDLYDFYKAAIKLHKKYSCLKTGSILILLANKNILSFARFNEKEKIIVVINNNDEIKEINVPIWRAEVKGAEYLQKIILTYNNGYNLEYDRYLNYNGELILNLPAHSGIVLKAV